MTETMARPTPEQGSAPDEPADVFVVFGITGDLAKVMTFRSLYRLEQRGLLDCPIVGVAVDDWTLDQLVERARTSIEGTGETLDAKVFDRFAARLSYVHGDFADAATYERVGEAIAGAASPVFYLEIPPFLFGRVVKGLAEAGLTKNARVVVEKPFGHDTASARGARRRAPPVHRRVAAPPHRPLPREDGSRGDPLPPVRQHDARAGVEPELRRRACRSRWPRTSVSRTGVTSTTRSARCATWSSTTSCRSSPRRSWKPPARRRPATLQGAQVAAFRAIARPTRRTTCAASTTATATSTASQPTRRPRPTPLCGWTSRTGAGPACPSSSVRASDCP